jgi:hypothetical protein
MIDVQVRLARLVKDSQVPAASIASILSEEFN